MSNHQNETAFLRKCLLYGETEEHHKLGETIAQLQHNERCVRRAVWLMVLSTAVSVAGLGYAAIFLVDYPQNMSRFMAQVITKSLCVLGLGSLICLAAFVALGAVYRNRLDHQREECRRLAARLLETCLGNPHLVALPELVKEQNLVAKTISVTKGIVWQKKAEAGE